MRKNCNFTLRDSEGGYQRKHLTVSVGENFAPLASRPGFCSDTLEGQPLNTNGYMFGGQNFQTEQAFLGDNTCYDPHFLMLRGLSALNSHQEYPPVDSPTLTTNSERSEITEASTDFNFLGGSQQLVRGQQQLDTSHIQSMQQSTYNDMQLLQQQMMFRQMQDIQRQQQLQQFDDARQQGSQHQISAFARQSTGSQYPSYINGTSISDSSEMFMNRAHQGVYNQLMFSQDKGQSFHSALLVPQQLDESNYRTPISSGRGSMGQYTQLQGMDRDSCSLLTRASGHCLKPTMQPVAFSSSSIGNINTVSTDHFTLSQIGRSKPGFQGKNLFEQIPNQGLDAGIKSGNIQQKNSLQTNGLFTEFQGGQDGAGWLGTSQQKVNQLDASQYFVPLDPIEQKLLYNVDHNMWDTSLGKCTNDSNGSFENNLIQSDYSNVFPSIQSGSWSALMQSAVAEASSSDTGIQEEWSGLTFQNTELSTENQHSNIVDSKKEQSAWYENSMHSASSLSSRPYASFNDSSMSSSFPGFQQSGIQPSLEQTEHLCREDSLELNKNPSEKTGEWLDNKSAQKRLVDQSQHVQPLEQLNNSLASQIYDQAEYDRPPQHRTTSHDNINQPHGKQQGRVNEVPHNRRDYQTGKASNDFRHLENMKHVVNMSMNSENDDIMRKTNSQISDDPIVLQNSFDKAGDSVIEKLQQKDNSRDQYILKQLSSEGQGHFQQSYLFDVSSNAMNLEKGQLTGFQRNFKSSDGTPRGNLDASTNFCKSTGSNGPNPYNRLSENVHGHLQNIDQAKENISIPHYNSIGSSPLSMMTEAVFPNPSVSQHYNQSTSQDFTMRLLHPCQQLSFSHKISSSQGFPQPSSNLDTKPVNSEFVEKNQTLLAPPSSIQSMTPSNESLQNTHWDEKSHCLGEAQAATSLFLPSHFVTDENQGQFASGAPAARFSPHAASLPSATSRYPQFGLASSQDTSRHINSNLCGKQYPVFEAHPISQPLSMSRIGKQGGLLARQQNVWSNNTSLQHNTSTEANKVGDLNNTLEATLFAPHGFNDQASQKCGVRLLEPDISTNSLDYDHKDEIPEQKIRSDVYNTLVGDGAARKITNTNAFPSGLLLVHPHQQDYNRMQAEDKNGLTTSERDSLFDNFSKLPHVSGQQYSLPKVLPLKIVDTEPKGVPDAQQVTAVSTENSTRENTKHGQSCASELNSLPSENRKMLNLLAGGREDSRVKSLSDNPLNTCSRGFTSDGQSEAVNEFNRINMEGTTEENSQINPLSVSSWFKFRNGQRPSMYNELLAKHPGGHFSLLKPSENLCKQSSLDGTDSADVNQSGRIWSTAATTMVATDLLTAPYGLPSTATVKTAAIERPKKRKFDSSEFQPWHLEVPGFQRIVNISVAEQDWAQTTNRLTEKMVNEVEMVEGIYVMLRSKRRLIMTTQMLQQLVCPAPSFILSADASSFYDSVIYFILRSSLGETCSLMCGQRNNLRVSLDNKIVMSEEHGTVKCTDDKYIEKTVERFCARAGKLENDLQRLDRTASIVDLMVECQELERFSVINRFAKFHIRQAELPGNPSSNGLVTLAPKSCPQRFVTAHPISSHIPEEGAQCLSL